VSLNEIKKDNASQEETKDTSNNNTQIGDYLVTHAKYTIVGSYVEEDVIVVKHHDLQMWGPSSSSTIGYIMSTVVETVTNSVTYYKEDGFTGLEEENTSSNKKQKKAPYFEDHHNNNNDI
jgi:hypothetical protein